MVQNSIIKWIDYSLTDKHMIFRKIIYKEKKNRKRKFKSCHNHIIVRDFSQVFGENFTETFIFVVKITTLHIYLVLVTYLDWDLEKIDIVTIFLNKKLEKKIYTKIPKEF